jgi:hypothetical protein
VSCPRTGHETRHETKKDRLITMINHPEISIQDAQNQLKCSRSTLYKRLLKQGITPKKRGRNAYLTQDDLNNLLQTVSIETQKPVHHVSEDVSSDETRDKTEDTSVLVKYLTAQLKTEQEKNQQLHAKNEQLHEKMEQLSSDLGEWRGQAKAYQLQHQKLLEVYQQQEITRQRETRQTIAPISSTQEQGLKTWWRKFWQGS